MKTAMQELIDWGDEMLFKHPQKILGFGEAIDKAEELLEKEKEQIIYFAIGAYQHISRMKGVSENLISENKILFEKYYNHTFNEK
jgi:hypothetical protein